MKNYTASITLNFVFIFVLLFQLTLMSSCKSELGVHRTTVRPVTRDVNFVYSPKLDKQKTTKTDK